MPYPQQASQIPEVDPFDYSPEEFERIQQGLSKGYPIDVIRKSINYERYVKKPSPLGGITKQQVDPNILNIPQQPRLPNFINQQPNQDPRFQVIPENIQKEIIPIPPGSKNDPPPLTPIPSYNPNEPLVMQPLQKQAAPQTQASPIQQPLATTQVQGKKQINKKALIDQGYEPWEADHIEAEYNKGRPLDEIERTMPSARPLAQTPPSVQNQPQGIDITPTEIPAEFMKTINLDYLKKSGYNDKERAYVAKRLYEFKQQGVDPDFNKIDRELNILNIVYPEMFDNPKTHPMRDLAIDYIRPIAASLAGMGGAAGAQKLGMNKILAKYGAGPATYLGADVVAQMLRSRTTNDFLAKALELEPGSPEAMLTNTAEQKALDFGVGKTIGALGKLSADMPGAPNFLRQAIPRSRIAERGFTTAQALRYENKTITAKIAEFLQDVFAPATVLDKQKGTATILSNEARDIGTTIGHNILRSDFDNPTLLFEAVKQSFPRIDPKKLPRDFVALDKVLGVGTEKGSDALTQALLTAGSRAASGTRANLRKDLGGYLIGRIEQNARVPSASNPAEFYLDIDKVKGAINDIGKRGIQDKLWGPQQREAIEEWMKAVGASQSPLSKHPNWRFGPTGMAVLGNIANLWISKDLKHGATGLGVTFGGHALGRILMNPSAARVFTHFVGGEPLGMPMEAASKIIANSLIGTTVAISNAQGEIVGYKKFTGEEGK